MAARVLAIGLDGAPPELVFRWAREGILPNISGLMAKGAYGPLRSTIPPMTCPAWTSSVTGVDIHKHGLYDFFLSADLSKKRLVLADARKRKVRALWSLLNEEGKKTVVINLPATYPPERVDGAMVTGMLTPSARSRFTYPPGLREELLDMGYMIDIGETMLEKVMLFKRSPEAYLREVVNMVVKRTEAALYLMREFEWDFFLAVFVALDRVNHLFWRHMDPGHEAHDAPTARLVMPWVMRCYRAVDEAVGKLVEEAGRGTNVLIYSDHGFKALNYFVFFNNLLRREGLLAVKGLGPRPLLTHDLLVRLSRWLPLPHLTELISAPLKRAIGHVMRGSKDTLSFFDIDPDATMAYQLGQFIHINREAVGGPEEEEQLIDRIMRAIRRAYRITRVRAYTREELFGEGARVPAIVLLSEGTASPNHIPTVGGELMRKYDEKAEAPTLMWCGDHDLYGTLIMAGPDIGRAGYMRGARIVDVAPTVLKLFGIDIPSHMDGRPLI